MKRQVSSIRGLADVRLTVGAKPMFAPAKRTAAQQEFTIYQKTPRGAFAELDKQRAEIRQWFIRRNGATAKP